jgi:hypothetical protein
MLPCYALAVRLANCGGLAVNERAVPITAGFWVICCSQISLAVTGRRRQATGPFFFVFFLVFMIHLVLIPTLLPKMLKKSY